MYFDPKEAEMKYCGIDLHSNNSVVIVSDEEDRIVVHKRLPNDLRQIAGSGGRDAPPPDEHKPLRAGDRILFAGEAHVERPQRRVLNHDGAVHYLRTGREPVPACLGRLLARDGGAAGRPATVRAE